MQLIAFFHGELMVPHTLTYPAIRASRRLLEFGNSARSFYTFKNITVIKEMDHKYFIICRFFLYQSLEHRIPGEWTVTSSQKQTI